MPICGTVLASLSPARALHIPNPVAPILHPTPTPTYTMSIYGHPHYLTHVTSPAARSPGLWTRGARALARALHSRARGTGPA